VIRPGPGPVAVVLLLLLMAAPAGAVPPRSVELPEPELPLTVAPISLGLTRPALEPLAPPAPAAPAGDVGLPLPPVPRFQTLAPKPIPNVRDPGGSTCTFNFGRASSLAECGAHRFFEGDLRGARLALEDSLQKEPRGPQAAAVYVWLGEIAFRESNRYEEAERHYRAALNLGPPVELRPHAALGLAWIALRRGDVTEAQRALATVIATPPPQPVALVARFLEGVLALQSGRPQQALPAWDAVASAGPPPQLAEELLFWRGIALARQGQLDPALQSLDGFLATAAATHPLRADAIVQSGWVALGRGVADDAVRRFLWAQSSSPGPRPDLMPPLRAGLARAYVALGDAARARDTARPLKADSPRNPLVPPVLLLLADDAVRRNAMSDAVEAYRELLSLPLDPPLAEYVTYRLAEGLEQLGTRAESEKQYRALRDTGRVEGLAQRAAYRLGLLALRAQRPGDARNEGEVLLRAGVLAELREAVILLTAEAAARADDANRAVTLFRLALRDYPTSPRAGWMRLALGWSLLRDGEPESALREWQGAVLANDLEVAVLAHLAIAEVALRQGRESDTLASLRELARLAPAHLLGDTLALNRGILLIRAKEDTAAVAELEPLVLRITDPPRQATLRRALAVARYHLGQFDAAEREFVRATHLAPAEPSHYLGAGLAALAQNRLNEADKGLTTARLAAAPEIAVPATYALVLVADRRRDADLFRERATLFVDRYPAHPYTSLLLYRLVRQGVDRRELEQADTWLKRLLRDQPNSELIPDALGLVAEASVREKPVLARQAYEELLARVRDPEVRSEAWLGMAEAAMALRNVPETRRALEAFLAEAPRDDARGARALALLVDVYEGQGQRDQALAATEAFLARFPSHAAATGIQLRRGYLLLIGQQWDAAQEALQAARSSDEPVIAASAHFYLGELHRSRSDFEAATTEYLAAAYVYPDTAPWSARGLQGAVQCYLARQMPREASIVLRKLLGRSGLEPDLAQWARDRLTRLGPITGEDPAQVLRKGSAARP